LRPGYVANHGSDGSPALSFSGGTRLSYSPVAGLANGNFTAIWLFNKTTGVSAFWSQSNTVDSDTRVWAGIVTTTGRLSAKEDAGPEFDLNTTAGSATDGAWNILTVRRSGNVWGVRLNESAEETTTNALGAITTDQATIGGLMLAAAPNLSFEGFLREGFIFDAYKSNAEQVLVRQFIRDGWPGI
jgi:hypothetical protein